MKKLIILLVIFFSFQTQISAQAYVKFSETPKMQLTPAKNYFNYSIAYKALKKSTIYLELKKGNQLVGTGVYLINKPGSGTINMPIKILTGVKNLRAGDNYSYSLYMYEGGRNDWTNKACKTRVIRGVKMRGDTVKRPRLINTFN